MTSWLRGSTLRTSLSRKNTNNIRESHLEDVDPSAAFHTFIKHWQQTNDIINKTNGRKQVHQDDVTAVVNHLAQMGTLLLVDLRQMKTHSISKRRRYNGASQDSRDSFNNHVSSLPPNDPPNTPIFDHFLGEEILDKILSWSLTTGEFMNVLKLEQLKVHELLLNYSNQEILVYKPIIQPLAKLLHACGGCEPVEVEKRLVVLLNQLCVSLMNNHQLLDFFFQAAEDQGPTKFMIFSLLLPFVHREGNIGQQARDALLLCMALSASHVAVGEYIAKHSNFCPVLAAGMSGLYSMLPRQFAIDSDGWSRISDQDIKDIPDLQMFLNSLEFCNAVVQVAHPQVKEQLVDYIYQGFLVPVLGPALYQDGAVVGKDVQNSSILSSVISELISSTAYVDLFLRKVTEPELVRAFLAFLLTPSSTSSVEPPIVTTLISRLHSSNHQLCLVTLNLFYTMINLHNEDAMIVLIYQYLVPCTHIMACQRSSLTQPLDNASDRLLLHVPAACVDEEERVEDGIDAIDLISSNNESIHKKSSLTIPPPSQHQRNRSQSSMSDVSSDVDIYSCAAPSKYTSYLDSVRQMVSESYESCTKWTWQYDGNNPTPGEAIDFLDEARRAQTQPYPKPAANVNTERLQKIQNSTGELAGKILDRQNITLQKKLINSEGTFNGLDKLKRNTDLGNLCDDENFDSLGESSGYESFNVKLSRDTSPTHSTNGTMASNSLDRRLKNVSKDDLSEFYKMLEDVECSENGDIEETINIIENTYKDVAIFEYFSDTSSQFSEDERDDVNWENPPWIDLNEDLNLKDNSPSPDITQPCPTIGPFLEALLQRVDQMLTSSIYTNLLVTSIISRLSCYPTPLLSTLLLQPSIVFQPSVRPLNQVLSGLKQRMDTIIGIEDIAMINEARLWFASRLFYNVPRTPITPSSPSFSKKASDGADGRRRSISQTMMGLFTRGKAPEKNTKESALENLPDGAGYRYVRRASISSGSEASTVSSGSSNKMHVARCAVLFRDWLMELSAIAREHCVTRPYFELPQHMGST